MALRSATWCLAASTFFALPELGITYEQVRDVVGMTWT